MMRDFLAVTGIVAGATVLVLALIVVPAYFLTSAGCYAAYSEYNPEFGMFSGCRIEWQGRMTPVELIREVRLAD